MKTEEKRIFLRKPTEKEIEENLEAVEERKPLTIPLAVLNGQFKEKYFGEEYKKQVKSEAKRRYRRKNKEKVNKYQREYYRKNREKAKKCHRDFNRKKYNIPPEKWRLKNETTLK